MIRRETEEGWILINQHCHAELAGEIMERWGNKDFERPNPYDEVIFAVREHDCGWKDWDSSPKVNLKNQYPMNFMEIEPPDQHKVWRRCYETHSSRHPYASALIALHFSKFNLKSIKKNPNDGRANALKKEITGFVSEMLELKVSESGSIDLPDEVKTDLRFVQIGDVISLALCHGWNSISIRDVPRNSNCSTVTLKLTSADGHNFLVSPYPFSEPLIGLGIEGRRLNRKKFFSDEELRRELDQSEPETLRFSVRSE